MRYVTTLYLMSVVTLLIVGACSTGVESVPKITERDVEKQTQRIDSKRNAMLSPYSVQTQSWQKGKSFFVTDNQAKLLFRRNERLNPDTLLLKDKIIYFSHFEQSKSIDNKQTTYIVFTDENNNLLVYNTGKGTEALNSNIEIPFLIDLDMVKHYKNQIVNKEFYIITPLWFSTKDDNPINGRKYIKVSIDSVLPGNKVYPLRVVFTDMIKQQQAMVWINVGKSNIPGRDFESMFTIDNPRLRYSNISNETWELIVEGKVKNGMTKDECRLSLGAPNEITRLPNQDGLHELWHYDNGMLLRFDDGILTQQR